MAGTLVGDVTKHSCCALERIARDIITGHIEREGSARAAPQAPYARDGTFFWIPHLEIRVLSAHALSSAFQGYTSCYLEAFIEREHTAAARGLRDRRNRHIALQKAAGQRGVEERRDG